MCILMRPVPEKPVAEDADSDMSIAFSTKSNAIKDRVQAEQRKLAIKHQKALAHHYLSGQKKQLTKYVISYDSKERTEEAIHIRSRPVSLAAKARELRD